MIAVRCMLFVVCCALCVVRCLLFVGVFRLCACLLFVVYRMLLRVVVRRCSWFVVRLRLLLFVVCVLIVA